jgi:hypothetical protein
MQALATLVRACMAAARDDRQAACDSFERAVRALAAADMPLHAAAAERRLGLLLGGEAGAARIASADASLRERSVAAPDRWTEMLVGPAGT